MAGFSELFRKPSRSYATTFGKCNLAGNILSRKAL